MALFTENNRSKFESMAYTALLLAFFFAVGLAGGVLYRLLPTGSGTEIAAKDTPSRVAVATPAPAASAPAPVAPAKPSVAAPEPASTPGAAAPAKPPTTLAKAATPPAKPAPVAPASPPATASATLPQVAAPATQPLAAVPATIAPIAAEPAPVTANVTTASDRMVADIPAPAKAPDSSAAHPASTAKLSAAAAKPKAAQAEKRVAAAGAPLAPALAPEGASGPVRVQFGAFAIEDNAHQTLWAVQATGLPVEITQMTTPKGRVLYYVRSQPFANRAAAVSAATAAQDKAKGFVNPVAIDYVIVSDAAKPTQQAQSTASH